MVPFWGEAVNNVSVSGTVLTEPKVHHFAPNQVAASVRLGLLPRAHRPGVTQYMGAATVDCFGALALQLAQHVHKGSRIQVRGMLKEDSRTDKTTKAQRSVLKIVAEELALLAPPQEHAAAAADAEDPVRVAPPRVPNAAPAPKQQEEQQQPAAQQEQAGQAVEQQEQQPGPHLLPQQKQPKQPKQKQPKQKKEPGLKQRFSSSAEQSRAMYEEQGMALEAIAAERGRKLGTIIDHITAAASAGALSSWQRLASDLRLGPPGSPLWLSPSEVADAILAVQQDYPEVGDALDRLPMKALRTRLESGADTGAKVAALLASTQGDTAFLYGAIKFVTAMLEQGVSFTAVHTPPAPAGSSTGVPPREGAPL